VKKENVIIFGGNGFIGKHLANLLNKRNYHVTIFDQKINKDHFNFKTGFIKGSITNEKQVDQAVCNKDYIFHFAGEADIYQANKNPLNAVKKNVLGTTIILDKAVKYKVKRFMFASSIYVFSEQGGVYRTTKQSCELLIENYSQIYGLKYTNLRFGSLYGPGANDFNFLRQMINEACTKGKMIRNGDGSEVRNYVNVLDVAKYCYIAMKKKYQNKNIMILGQERKSIKQVLNLIKSKMKNEIKIIYTGNRDFAHYKTSPFTFKNRKIDYLKNITEIPFEKGIEDLIKEIKDECRNTRKDK
tara:strand:+ start:4291 stop:5190 length:900 start_codon:yes stop_codon:yes gene_type:complete